MYRYRLRTFNPSFLDAELNREEIYLWHLDELNGPF